MNFQQKSNDRKEGMSIDELKRFIARVEQLGASGSDRPKANGLKIKNISIEFEVNI